MTCLDEERARADTGQPSWFLERFADPTHARVWSLTGRGRVVHQTAVNVRHELVSA